MNFHVGTPGAYELIIEINKKRLFDPSIVKVVETHTKVKEKKKRKKESHLSRFCFLLKRFSQHYEDFRFEITSEVFNGGHVGRENVINICSRSMGKKKKEKTREKNERKNKGIFLKQYLGEIFQK